MALRPTMNEAHFRTILRASADPAFRRLLLFVRWTAMPMTAAVSLRWADVGGRAFPEKAARLLAWIHANRRFPTVFANRRGEPWTALSVGMRLFQLKKRLGIPGEAQVGAHAQERDFVVMMRLADRPLRRVFYFIRRSGARIPEALTLRWDCVRLDDDTPHVVINTRKIGDVQRTIALDASTARFLGNLKRRAASVYVFTNARGKPWTRNAFSHLFQRVASRDASLAGRLNPYSFRRLFIKKERQP